jgi:hypothetical protein
MNLPWLSVAGWVRYQDGEIRCGAGAVAYDQERATRHHIKRELRLEARERTGADEGEIAHHSQPQVESQLSRIARESS